LYFAIFIANLRFEPPIGKRKPPMKLQFRSATPPKERSPTQTERATYTAYLRRLQIGDNAAWELFVSEWSPYLYNYVRANLGGADEVEDILSDILLGIVEGIRSFDGNVALSTFVYSIAYRKVVDYWRRRRITVELPEELSTADSTLSFELYEILAELPEQGQQALILRYYVGLSVSEVAIVLGRSYKATESLLSRVRHQFQKAFRERSEA
jgi:RNA polymerase sigma-70 factor, ECF subfamily